MFALNHLNDFRASAGDRVSSALLKPLAVLLAALLVCFMCFPTVSFGDDVDGNAADPIATAQPSDDEPVSDAEDIEVPSAPETYITVRYNEHYNHDLDGNPSEDGTRLLGVRSFPATVGEEINTWDYVANIPGFFFWDGWPSELTVSEDPSDNVIELFYMRLSIASYTVNYYAMVGADLTADNWSDALETDPQFYLLGQTEHPNQLFDKLVLGNEYAYDLEGTYIVGTYPESIRLSLDADKNVINVLYVPKEPLEPDNGEGDKPEAPDPDPDGGSLPDPDIPDVPETPDVPDNGGGDSGEGSEIVPILPPSLMPPVLEFPDDPITDDVEITDEMLANAPTQEQAAAQKAAYESGFADGTALAQTGDDMMRIVIPVVLIGAVAAIAVIYSLYRRQK